MLSFISFWRAAAIVLCDLASSSFYAGGIAEGAIGKSAPWFILGIMSFAYAVRAIYIESCSMFVRGGVYRVVHEAMGGTLAKFSVSALMFDYVLTGPISGVSAGLYMAGLINDTAKIYNHPEWHVNPGIFAAGLAIAVTVYFWRKNIIGMHESSTKALRIMQLTTVMVVMLFIWCAVTISIKGFAPIPLPTLENFRMDDNSLGWLKHTGLEKFWIVAVMVGLGHSLLAMSGFESLAQVNREIAHPKLKNLQKAGTLIFVYSLVFTSAVSFLAVMLIPDGERVSIYKDNLIGGLAMYMVGPELLRLLFNGFVVVVGTVILAGAVNTSILGSNGVLNRVAEDGVLPDWFRSPHPKFGTTHRMINVVVGLQIFTIIITAGNIELLGEAYAFGVVWSFAMKSLSVLVLRFKQPHGREWKVPLNFHIAGVEIPVGLGLITTFLFTLAVTNLMTKRIATVSGIIFTLVFYIIFHFSEQYHKRHRSGVGHETEKFLLDPTEQSLSIRPGAVLVPVSNPHLLAHVKKALSKTDTRRMDIAVLTVKLSPEDLDSDQLFNADTAALFSTVVSLAEKEGKHVELMAVQGMDSNAAIVEAAARVKASLIVMGRSAKITPEEQAKVFGDAWERLPAPRPQVSLEIVERDGTRSTFFNLGPHPPRLWPEDVDLLHNLWLKLSEKQFGHKIHHRDVVRIALRRLEKELDEVKPDELH